MDGPTPPETAPPVRAPRAAPSRARPVDLVRSEDGVSALEFAIVAPVLLLMLLGMFDLVPTLIARLKVNHSTEAAADVASSYSQLQTSDMVNVYAAAADVIKPLSGTTLSLRVTNVYSDGLGNAKVYWSCGQGTIAAYAAQSTVTTTPGGSPVDWLLWRNNTVSGLFTLNGTNTSYVMTEVRYTYTSPAQFVITLPVMMTGAAYLLPRLSSYVGFPWNGAANTPPPAPASTTRTSSVTLSNGVVCNYAY